MGVSNAGRKGKERRGLRSFGVRMAVTQEKIVVKREENRIERKQRRGDGELIEASSSRWGQGEELEKERGMQNTGEEKKKAGNDATEEEDKRRS